MFDIRSSYKKVIASTALFAPSKHSWTIAGLLWHCSFLQILVMIIIFFVREYTWSDHNIMYQTEYYEHLACLIMRSLIIMCSHPTVFVYIACSKAHIETWAQLSKTNRAAVCHFLAGFAQLAETEQKRLISNRLSKRFALDIL